MDSVKTGLEMSKKKTPNFGEGEADSSRVQIFEEAEADIDEDADDMFTKMEKRINFFLVQQRIKPLMLSDYIWNDPLSSATKKRKVSLISIQSQISSFSS